MKKIVFPLILFVLTGINSFAQVNVSTTVHPVAACGDSVKFSLTVVNNSGSVIDSSKTLISFASGVKLTSVSTSGISTSYNPLTNLTTLFIGSMANGTSKVIDYYVKASCYNISTNVNSLTDNLTFSYKKGTTHFSNNLTQTYAFTYPSLTYNSGEAVNLTYNNANVGDVFWRTIKIRNLGTAAFNGQIHFSDIYGPSASIDSISVLASSGITISNVSSSIANNRAVYDATIQNMPRDTANTGLLTISVRVNLTGCLSQGLANSNDSLKWGCNSTDLCNLIVENPVVNPGNFTANLATVFPNFVAYQCSGTALNKVIKIYNNGNAPAKNVRLRMTSNYWNMSSSLIDTSTISFITKNYMEVHRDTLTMLNHFYLNPLNPNFSCVNQNPGSLYEVGYTVNELRPGDTLYFSFDYYNCCESDTNYFNRYKADGNTGSAYHGWYFGFDFQNSCDVNNRNTFLVGYNDYQSFAGLWQTDANFVTDMSVTQMGVGDTATIFINNNKVREASNIYKFDNASFKVKIKLDYGLRFKPGSLYMKAVDGTTWNASSFELESFPNPNSMSCPDQTLTAIFDWNRFYNYDSLKVFVDGSKLQFDVIACCNAESPKTFYTEEVYLIPDSACSVGCEMPLARIKGGISIHCPGCVTPGMIGYAYKMERTNFGLQDNDYNGLPDIPLTEADVSKIDLRRAIVGDTLLATWKAYFIDGDDGNGGISYANLQANNNVTLDHCYLLSIFEKSNRLKPLGAKVIINRGTTTYGPFNLPVSAIESYGGNKVLVDASLNVLYGAGLTNTFTFQPSDQVWVMTDYKLLGNQNGESVERIEIINKMYLSGEAKNSTTIGSIQEAGEVVVNKGIDSLKAANGYVCEGFGGVFFQVAYQVGQQSYQQAFDGVYTYINNFTDYNYNYCLKQISAEWDITQMGLGALDYLFPYEYRDVKPPLNKKVLIPDGYTIKSLVRISRMYRINKGIIRDFAYNGDTIGYTLHNDTLTVNFLEAAEMNTTNTYNVPNPSATEVKFTYFDTLPIGNLFNQSGFTLILAPECRTVADTTMLGSIETNYVDQPVTPGNFSTNFGISGAYLTNVKPPLTFTNNSPLVQVGGNEVCWDVTLANTPDVKRPLAPYVYLFTKNNSGRINNVVVHKKNTSVYINPDANGIYRLETSLNSGDFKQYEICATYSCTKNTDRIDSLKVYYGWNCDGFPTSIHAADLCFIDSVYLLMSEVKADFSATYSVHPDTISACDTILHYQVRVSPTNIGQIDFDNLSITLPAGLTIRNGSSFYNGTSLGSNPQTNGNVITWDLAGANLGSTSFTLDFDLHNNGGYNGVSFSGQVFGETFCGDIIHSALVSSSVFINYLLPQISAPSTVCSGSASFSVTATPNGGILSGKHLVGNTYTPPVVTAVTTDTLTYVYSTSSQCTATVSKIITVYPVPVLNIVAARNVICKNQSTTLTASGSATFIWSTGETSSSISVSPLTTTTYTVSDANHCASASVTITVDVVAVTATSNSPVNVGSTLNLTASGSYTSYHWTGPNGFSSNLKNPSVVNVGATAAGTYTVTATDQFGCSASATTTVVVNPAGPGNCASCGKDKVLICHIPPGNGANPQTICISINAQATHFNLHGDYCGPCNKSIFQDQISNAELMDELLVYPNPFNSIINFEYTATEDGSFKVEIYDLTGKLIAHVFEGTVQNGQDYHFEYDGSKLPNGVYQYKITSNNKQTIGKLIRIKD